MNKSDLNKRIEDEIKRRQAAENPQPRVGVRDVVKEVPHAAGKIAKAIGNFVSSGTQSFGQDIGGAAAAGYQANQLQQGEDIKDQTRTKLIEAIQQAKAEGRDATRLMASYRDLTGSVPDIFDINPTLRKSNTQIVGDAAGTLLEATAGGSISRGAKSFNLARNVAPEVINSATKQATKKAVAAATAKSVGVGAAQGYAYDVSGKLREGKSVKESLKPGVGTALGAALPLAGGAVGLTRTEVQLHIDDLTKKGFTPDEARKIVSEGGYKRLIQSPKLQSLGDEVHRLDKELNEATSKTAYEKAKQAYDAALEAYRNESQAGFAKNPLASGTEDLVPKAGDQLGKPGEQIASGSKGLKGAKLQEPTPQLPDSKVPKDVSSYYNVDRLDINDRAKGAIKQEIDNAGAQLEKTVGKTLTNKEVLDIADTTSKVLDKTVTREQTANKIAANVKLRQKIAAVATSGKIDSDFIDLWMKDKSAGEDIARQLQARKVIAGPKEAQAIDGLLESIYKTNKDADAIKAAAEGVDFKDPEQVTKFYRTFVKPKAGEWIDALRYNSMLSSPTTHLTNISSNFQGTGILTPIEKTITGGIDAVRAALNGKPRKYAVGEGVAYAKGYYSNIALAKERFVNVMKGSKIFNYNPDIPINNQIPMTKGGAARVGENILKTPMRLLEGMDQFFSALTEGGIQSSLDHRLSKGIGSPDDIAQEAAKRLFRGELHSSEQGVVLDALDFFTGLLERARHADNRLVSNTAKFTLPFVRTPMNIFKQGIEYSPLGITTLWGAKNKEVQLAKIVIGTAAAAGAATLLGQDRLTWGEPVNAEQKAIFRASGRQPYSVKIGSHWISYSKLHPAIAFNLALVAALDDAKKNRHLDDSQADTVLSMFAKYGSFIADQSYVKNIGDLIGAIRGEQGGFSKLVSNYPQQLIPFRALMGYVERIVDPKQRQVDKDGSFLEKQMQQIMSQIPGLGEKVPARKGPLGEDIPNQNRLVNAISPNRVTTTDKTYEGLYQIDQKLSQAKRTKADLNDRIEKEIRRRMLQNK